MTTEQLQHHFEKPEKQSVGEKLWHDFTYTGVNYIGNLAISLVIWDFFTAGRGKPVQHFIGKHTTKGLQASGMSAANAASYGETISEMIFSPLGGHLMMVPVKYLEDHARYFTHKLNQLFDDKYKYKDLQATMATPESDLPPLSDEPSKQSWGQIAMRRGMGWGAVVAAGTTLTKLRGGRYRNILQNETEDFVTWGMKETSKATNTTALTRLSENATFKRYLNLAALDAYFTVITSAVTETTKSWFSKEDAHEETKPAAIAQAPTPVMQPSSIASHRAPMAQPDTDLIARASFVDALNKQGADHHHSLSV
jgi:hypothetical protein